MSAGINLNHTLVGKFIAHFAELDRSLEVKTSVLYFNGIFKGAKLCSTIK